MLTPTAKQLAGETIQRFNRVYQNQHDNRQHLMDKHKDAIKRLGWNGITDIFSGIEPYVLECNPSEKRKALDVVIRVVYGNSYWYDIDQCKDCRVGTWIMGACLSCPSKRFPGWVNRRTGSSVEPTSDMVRTVVKPFFNDEVVLEEVVEAIGTTDLYILNAETLQALEKELSKKY